MPHPNPSAPHVQHLANMLFGPEEPSATVYKLTLPFGSGPQRLFVYLLELVAAGMSIAAETRLRRSSGSAIGGTCSMGREDLEHVQRRFLRLGVRCRAEYLDAQGVGAAGPYPLPPMPPEGLFCAVDLQGVAFKRPDLCLSEYFATVRTLDGHVLRIWFELFHNMLHNRCGAGSRVLTY